MTTETATTDVNAPEARRMSLPELVNRIAKSLAPERATVPRAHLRRAPLGPPTHAAFWDLYATEIVPAGWGRARAGEEARAARETRWAVTLGVLAELACMHDRAWSLGGAMARAGVSETRVARMLGASGPALWREVRAVATLVGHRGVCFDHAEIAALLLSDEPHLRDWHDGIVRRTARGYYAARAVK